MCCFPDEPLCDLFEEYLTRFVVDQGSSLVYRTANGGSRGAGGEASWPLRTPLVTCSSPSRDQTATKCDGVRRSARVALRDRRSPPPEEPQRRPRGGKRPPRQNSTGEIELGGPSHRKRRRRLHCRRCPQSHDNPIGRKAPPQNSPRHRASGPVRRAMDTGHQTSQRRDEGRRRATQQRACLSVVLEECRGQGLPQQLQGSKAATMHAHGPLPNARHEGSRLCSRARARLFFPPLPPDADARGSCSESRLTTNGRGLALCPVVGYLLGANSTRGASRGRRKRSGKHAEVRRGARLEFAGGVGLAQPRLGRKWEAGSSPDHQIRTRRINPKADGTDCFAQIPTLPSRPRPHSWATPV